MKTVLFFILFLAFCPTLAKIIYDRNGTKHPNFNLIWVGLLMGLVSIIGHVLYKAEPVWAIFQVSVMFYVSLFPYIVNIVQYHVTKDKRWYNHLSATAWPDKEDWYNQVDWRVRMFFLLSFLAASIILFFDPDKIIAYGR